MGNVYSFVFSNTWGMDFGTQTLVVTVWDADNDRSGDSLSSTISGTFALTVAEIGNFILGEIADVRNEVVNRVPCLFKGIITSRLNASERLITGALAAYAQGCIPLSIILDKLAKANVELSDLIMIVLDWIGIISKADSAFISNYLHMIRDHITLTMGVMVGTEAARTIARIETEVAQLADQIFNDYRLCISLSIDLKLWTANGNLDQALLGMATGCTETVTTHVVLAEGNLESAKAKIIQFKENGDISANEAQSLITAIDGFITELTALPAS